MRHDLPRATACLQRPSAHISPGGEACANSAAVARGRLGDDNAVNTKDAEDPLIHKAYLEELAGAYAPAPLDRADPLISPLFADFQGFPPTLIQVGSAETLLADATRLAAAMGAADVAVTLEIWPRMIHAWPLWNARLADGRKALERAGAFMRR